MSFVPPRSRELAERSSNGKQVRLVWWQGTEQLWVEVREPDEMCGTVLQQKWTKHTGASQEISLGDAGSRE